MVGILKQDSAHQMIMATFYKTVVQVVFIERHGGNPYSKKGDVTWECPILTGAFFFYIYKLSKWLLTNFRALQLVIERLYVIMSCTIEFSIKFWRKNMYDTVLFWIFLGN